MLRIALALFYVALSTPALAQITGSLPPATPSLKREISVASDLVRIGDLIDNAGERARVPIFRSPDLGQTGTVSAERVIEAVRAHGFTVVETSGVSEVAVTLVYQAPGLVLTIRGKALESGAQGDAINVLNLQSKRTLQGTVSGAGEV